MPNIDQKLFNQNLILTQRYCTVQSENQQMSIAEIFRSFNPKVNGHQLRRWSLLVYPIKILLQNFVSNMCHHAGSTYLDRFELEIRHPFKKPRARANSNRDYMQPQFVNETRN